MSDPVQSSAVRNRGVPPQNSGSTGQSTGAAQPATPPPAPPADEVADQAAAELDLLAQRRRSPRRRRAPPGGDRPDLTPRHVAERLVSPEANAARYAEVPPNPFFEAMEPAERADFMKQVAEKLADVGLSHIEGLVDAFNFARSGLNALRRLNGEQELPYLELEDRAAVRGFLQMGIEHGLEAGVHEVLKTALHSIFGEPSRLPQRDDPANPLGPLPALEQPSVDGIHLRFSGSF